MIETLREKKFKYHIKLLKLLMNFGKNQHQENAQQSFFMTKPGGLSLLIFLMVKAGVMYF